VEKINLQAVDIFQSLEPLWLFKSVRDNDDARRGGGPRWTWDKVITKMKAQWAKEIQGKQLPGHSVTYQYKVYDGEKVGRRYAKGSVDGIMALQPMKSDLRPACVQGVDMDGVKMYFNLMCDLADDPEKDYTNMVEYAQNDAKILKVVQAMYQVDRKIAKLLFNTVYADTETADIVSKWRKNNSVMACNLEWEQGWFQTSWATYVPVARSC
jgi:hypothetical protein